MMTTVVLWGTSGYSELPIITNMIKGAQVIEAGYKCPTLTPDHIAALKDKQTVKIEIDGKSDQGEPIKYMMNFMPFTNQKEFINETPGPHNVLSGRRNIEPTETHLARDAAANAYLICQYGWKSTARGKEYLFSTYSKLEHMGNIMLNTEIDRLNQKIKKLEEIKKEK